MRYLGLFASLLCLTGSALIFRGMYSGAFKVDRPSRDRAIFLIPAIVCFGAAVVFMNIAF